MKYRKCEICGLKCEHKDGIKRFFMARFPLDVVRCKKLVKMTGNEDLAYLPIEKLHELKFVCGKDFDDKDFKKKKRLKKTAVPHLILTAKLLSDDKLIGFPCHRFKNQQAPNEEVPCTSSPTATLEIVEHPINVNENLPADCEKIYECDIPPVEYTVEVYTSEHQLDGSCIHAIPEMSVYSGDESEDWR